MTRALGLEGKIALVTGAGAGIGRGCALALADAGASVIVNDIDSAASEAVVRKCEERGSRALAVCADMTDSREVVRVYDVAERQWGPVQIVVSCVGTSVRRPLLETTAEQLHRTVELIVYSAFHTLQEGARRMIAAAQPGRMVTIGSLHADVPFRDSITYNIAKAGLRSLTRSFAAELVTHGILVNEVVPGLTDTPGERKYRTEEELAKVGRSLPLGRMASPDEIGRLVRFIVSDENPYMTGSIITADGGLGVTLTGGLKPPTGG